MTDKQKIKDRKGDRTVLVWDLPTRLFHWMLVGFVILSFVTGHIGGNAMSLHMLSGYVILSLLLFRLMWGGIGGKTARFSAFVRGPREVFRYASHLLKNNGQKYLGHNPMGGWSIIALLATLLLQVITGLFANDDIFTEGPLYAWVSKDASDSLTVLHEVNQGVIIALVSLHILAVLFYLVYKKENLITPMITGSKQWPEELESPAPGKIAHALIAMGLAALAVFLLVH